MITGRQCQPDAGNDACIITAHDAKTGKEVWRTRTIPLPGEPGYETWGDVPMAERWHVGTWMVPSYDPETNLIFVGTSVTIPRAEVHAGRQRQAAPLPQLDAGRWTPTPARSSGTTSTSSITGTSITRSSGCWSRPPVAPDPKEVPWINPRIKPGERRKVVTGIPARRARLHARSRTGEFLWARPTVMQNVIKGIDGATGEVTVNPRRLFSKLDETKLICPGAQGGKNWPAGAPTTPHQRDVLCRCRTCA